MTLTAPQWGYVIGAGGVLLIQAADGVAWNLVLAGLLNSVAGVVIAKLLGIWK